MPGILKFIGMIVAGYLALVLLLYFAQRNMMFLPDQRHILPQDVGLPGTEEVVLTNQAGERLYCWYAQVDSAKATILFFHGNGGNIAMRYDKFRQLNAAGYSVFMLGYPGYGGSEGSPSEPAFIEAGQLAYNYLLEQGLQTGNIVIYGESIGSGVAVQLAAAKDAQALILEAPMNSVREIAELVYWFIPVRMILKDTFLSSDYIKNIDMPLFVIHGDRDGVIPIGSGERLFTAANEPKEFHTVSGGGHNNLYDFPVVNVVDRYLAGLGIAN